MWTVRLCREVDAVSPRTVARTPERPFLAIVSPSTSDCNPIGKVFCFGNNHAQKRLVGLFRADVARSEVIEMKIKDVIASVLLLGAFVLVFLFVAAAIELGI
jgi:hypothetical protein